MADVTILVTDVTRPVATPAMAPPTFPFNKPATAEPPMVMAALPIDFHHDVVASASSY